MSESGRGGASTIVAPEFAPKANALKSSYFLEAELGKVGADLTESVSAALDPNLVFGRGQRWEFWEDRESKRPRG